MKTYAELNLQERWERHSRFYAFRSLTLDQPLVAGTSPSDPSGEWFDAAMIERELVELRRRRARPKGTVNEDMRREGRAIANAYARSKGFADFDTAFEAGAISYGEVVDSVLRAGGVPRMPGTGEPSIYDLTNLQEDLGVSAKEYAPSAAEMAASRAALGIREPEPPPREEATANA